MNTRIHRSIKTKMGAGFGVNLVLVCVLGAAAIAALWQATADMERLYQRNLAGLSTLSQINLHISTLQSDIKIGLNSSAQAANVRELPKKISDLEGRLDAAWASYYLDYLASMEEGKDYQFADATRAQYFKLKPALKAFAERMADHQLLAAASFYGSALRTPLEKLTSRLDTLRDMQLQSAGADYRAASTSAKHSREAVAGLVALVLVLTIGSMIWLTRGVTRPLRRARDLLDSIAAGRLDNTVAHPYRDEFGAMLDALSTMQARLAATVHGVRDTSAQVSKGSQQLAAGNNELSTRTQQQAANLEETASSMDEMTAIVKRNADNAAEADTLAREVKIRADEGGAVVERAVSSMTAIDASSRKIADIVTLIDEIAFQTNLLALNASVEAARAGQHGRGFAVVATEVRNLASRSAKAASEIKTLVAESAAAVAEGSKHVALSGETLEAIVASVNKAGDIVAEIAAASREQAGGIEQVNHAVSEMDTATQQNAVLVEQSADAGRALEARARALTEQVAFFQLAEVSSAAARPVPKEKIRAKPRPAAAASDAPFAQSRPAIASLRSPSVSSAEADEAEWATF